MSERRPTEFLDALLTARRVVFANGDMATNIDNLWFAYKNEGELANSDGGTVLVDEDNRTRKFDSLEAAWTALQDPLARLWRYIA